MTAWATSSEAMAFKNSTCLGISSLWLVKEKWHWSSAFTEVGRRLFQSSLENRSRNWGDAGTTCSGGRPTNS